VIEPAERTKVFWRSSSMINLILQCK